MTIGFTYYVTFGNGDGGDCLDWEIELTPEEEKAYEKAIKTDIPFDDVAELQSAWQRAYNEIEKFELQNAIDFQDPYAMECIGEAEMDCYELNKLVKSRDAHALDFFGLTGATDEDLEKWDAYSLDNVPIIKDFMEAFEPYSPFDEGWSLSVEFADPDDF